MNHSRRRTLASRVLIVVGAVLLVAGAIAGWADRTVFDADAFGARARQTLQHSSVRTVVARTLVRSVIERARPGLLAARPLVESAAEVVVATPAFASAFETAARTTANVLLEESGDNTFVRANDAVLLLIDTVRVYAPDVADQIPKSIDAALISIRDVGIEREIWRDAGRVRDLAWILPLLALLAWVIALWLAPDRRRGVELLGIATVIGGGLILIGLEVGGRLVGGAPSDPLLRDAVRAAWDTFTEGLRTLGWFGVAIGGMTAAAAFATRPEHERFTPRRLVDRLRIALTLEPSGGRTVVGLALVAGALGVALILAPLTVIEIIAVATGVLLVYFALAAVLDLIARPAAATTTTTVRRRPVVTVGIVLGLVLMVTTALVLVIQSPEAQSADEAIVTCNGHLVLCARRLDDVAFATAHNASSAANDGYLKANHVDGVPAQLRRGYRGFQLDAFLGTLRGGRVYTDLTDVQITSFTDDVGPDLVERALRLREIAGPPTDAQRQELYLCHAFCELGATKASEVFRQMARHLETHPNDVLFWVIEDYAPVDVLERELARAGLLDQRLAITPDRRLPTLRQMILTNHRLVVLLENQDGGSAMPNGYADGILQETPFNFSDPAALAAPASCDELRGLHTAPMFLLNHWITPASLPATKVVNTFAFLDDRARRCEAVRKLLPNLVAVDFTSVGETIEVVDALNGFGPPRR